MMRLLIVLLLFLAPGSLFAADDPNIAPKMTEQIRKQNSDLNIDAIRRTPVSGIYEITIGANIYYVDHSGKYLFSGHLFDTTKKTDLTAARLQEINKVEWSVLPLDMAIASGDADGVEMAVFTDPDCPYCRKLEESLKELKGVKVYTFLLPLTQLHPDARRKSEAIWCAKDRHAALAQVMLKGKPITGGGCKTPLNDIAMLAASLNIQGTPTIIAKDGRKLSGSMPAEQLKAWLTGK
ncbi:DsbC family protein [Pseudomonadota bacterium]